MSKEQNKLILKCNKCNIEWENDQNEAKCFCCDGQGNPVPQNNKRERFPHFSCLECNLNWSETNRSCLKCNKNGLKIHLFKCKNCNITCWDDINRRSNCPNCKEEGKRIKINSNKYSLKCTHCLIEWLDKTKKAPCPSCKGTSRNVKNKNFTKRFYNYACKSCAIEWEDKDNLCPKCNLDGIKINLFGCTNCNVKCWDDLKDKSKCPACSFDGKSLNTLRSKAKKPKQKQQEESKQDNNKKRKHQFTCIKCNNVWWNFELVSDCKVCKQSFKAIPADEEFGKCFFNCKCGKTFMGQGSLKLKSKCYKCNELILPENVLQKRILAKGASSNQSENKHSCEKCEGLNDCPIFDKILCESEKA